MMQYNQWLKNFKQWYGAQAKTAALAVVFPIYRPELVADLAAKMGLQFYDYRKHCMQPLGWEAAQLPISHLTEVARREMKDGSGMVLQNCEALLALHSEAARREWFDHVLAAEWPQTLLLPIALYAHDLPRDHHHVFTFLPFDLPEETLLDRLPNFS